VRTLSLSAFAAAGLAVIGTALTAQQPQPTAALNLNAVRKAVVTIHALDGGGQTIASGTGFYVGPEGLVVTAAHVLEDAAGCSIELQDGQTRRCSVMASDTAKDVLMLSTPGTAPAMLKWGSSDDAKDGDDITVVSNPLGELPGTLSKGIISASRVVGGTKLLQISAAISHGSSGAPVLNAQNQVIGVVRSTIERGQSLNFATATDAVRNMQMDPGAVAEGQGMLRSATASRPSAAAPAATSASSGPRDIAVGQSVNGTLSSDDQVYGDTTYYQIWHLTTRANEDVTLDLSSSDFDPVLIVRGAADSSLINDDGGPGCDSRVVFNTPGPGPFVILVNTTNTPIRQTGRFTLSVSDGRKPVDPRGMGDCNNRGSSAATSSDEIRPSGHSISVGQSVNGRISRSDELWVDSTYMQRWTIQGQAGQTVTVDLESDDFDSYLLIHGPGIEIGNNADDDSGGKCNSRFILTFPQTALYELAVNTQGAKYATGSFTLSVTSGRKQLITGRHECNMGGGGGGAAASDGGDEIHPTGHSINIGQSLSGRISRSDELWVDSTYIQRWTVQGSAGQTVTIDLESDDFDSYLLIHGPGIQIGDNADDDSGGNCNSRFVLRFPQTALYELAVNTQGRKYATGAFTITVTSGAKAKSTATCRRR
jgi:serine protease Do